MATRDQGFDPGYRQMGEQQDEFVAAEPSKEVALAQLSLPGRSGLDQGPISRRVAVKVVDRLEIIEVDDDEGQGRTDALGDGAFQCRRVEKAPAVQQSGQGV